MLKAMQDAAWFAAFAFVVAFCVLMATRASLSPNTHQEAQHQQQPAEHDRGTNPWVDENKQQKSAYWTHIKKQVQERNQFTNSVNNNDKLVVAISSIVVACFTVVLAIATGFLFLSADKSAKIAEQALIAGQRAFISVSMLHSPVKSASTGKIIGWTFTPTWKNSGETPTRNMVNHISMLSFDAEIDSKWDFPNIWSKNIPVDQRTRVPMGVAPKDITFGQTLFVDIDTLDKVSNNNKFLYIWGMAEYNDVIPSTPLHVTRFAMRIAIGGNPIDPEKTTITYPNLPYYNCSDEECERQGVPAGWHPREMEI
jgi:hypothetical protein